MATKAVYWHPRMMKAPQAAFYAGYPTAASFLRAVNDGEMPPGFIHGGVEQWDLGDLNDAIDCLKSSRKRGYSWQAGAADRV